MKQTKFLTGLFIIVALAAALLLAGCGNNPSTPAQGNSQPNPAANGTNVNIINTTFGDTAIDPSVLDIGQAAQVGIQYILDVFGQDVAGMYVELEFAVWDHVARAIWHGSVSEDDRNTLANRARNMELHEVIMARQEAGEDWEDIMADMGDAFRPYNYVPAQFYFIIDATTGKRIDIWQSIQAHWNIMDESIPLHEYIENEWDGDWMAASYVDVAPQERDALGQIAQAYAQRHFNNSTVTDMAFDSAFASFIYTGGGFTRDPSATFIVTDDTGRKAWVTIHIQSRTVTAITTMSNDFIPIEFEERMR